MNFLNLIYIIVFCLIYWITRVKIIKNSFFLKKKISASSFRKITENYEGYVMCIEEDFLKEEVEMMRSIFEFIEVDKKCILLDLTINSRKELNFELIKDIGIQTIPSIIKIDQEGIKEVANFSDFPVHFTNKQIISEIKKLLNRDDI